MLVHYYKKGMVELILVLLGTQNIPFQRLIDEVMELREKNVITSSEKIIIQAGSTQVIDSDGIEVYKELEHRQYLELIEKADLIITHGGAGSIFDALQLQKKVIALPRLLRYNEHVDDHQRELVEKLYKDGYIIGEKTLAESFRLIEAFSFKIYHSKQKQMIEQIQKYINE